MSAPFESKRVAQLCRKSCGDISGRPLDFIKRLTLCVSAPGERGKSRPLSLGNISSVAAGVYALYAFNSSSVEEMSGTVLLLFAVLVVSTTIPCALE